MRVACLDLGTNSFLCLIADRTVESEFSQVADYSRIVKLGQGLYGAESPSLHPLALIRAKECLQDFAAECRRYQVDRMYAVATSAAREASNRSELANICDALGIELEIVSGEREAELSYRGSVEPSQQEGSLVVDLGGGSTEFLMRRNEELLRVSLPIGTVRFTESFVTSFPTPQTTFVEMSVAIGQQLQLLPSFPSIRQIVAVAGTPTNLALLAQEKTRFEAEAVDGFRLDRSLLAHWRDKLAELSVEDRRKLPGMQKGREDVLPTGFHILLHILEHLQQEQMLVSSRGLRYGLAYEKLAL